MKKNNTGRRRGMKKNTGDEKKKTFGRGGDSKRNEAIGSRKREEEIKHTSKNLRTKREGD
jgi:hypothetical protein